MKNIANLYFIHKHDKRNYMYQEQKLACASSEDSNESVDPHNLISSPEETLNHYFSLTAKAAPHECVIRTGQP